jgi:hypothetical protein
MRTGVSQNGRRIALAIVTALLCAATAATAQDTPEVAPSVALSPEDSALLDHVLAADAFRFGRDRLPPSLRYRSLPAPKTLDVTRTDRPDGGGTVVVARPLATEWDAKVGADLGLAANPSSGFTPDNPLRVVPDDGGSGAAWASLAVPRLATIDARLDPSNDRGRLGTTFTRSVPLGEQFAVTLQSQASVTETYGQPRTSTSDVPLIAAPATTPSDPEPHVWGNVNTAKFDIIPTGTTLAAGLSSTSTDPVTHNKLSAEQKLYGALNLTTAVTDIGQPYESRSVSARIKLNW